MNNKPDNEKYGSKLALILGILGLTTAIAGVILFGWIGGVASLVLSFAAVSIGESVKKKTETRKGKGSVRLGVTGIVISLILTGAVFTVGYYVGNYAQNAGLEKLSAQFYELPYGGVFGMIRLMKENDQDIEDVKNELNRMIRDKQR